MVEVMGRSSGMIAITVAIATGAESVIFPDLTVDLKSIAKNIKRGIARGKKSSIVIVAEGEKQGLSYDYQKTLKRLRRRHHYLYIRPHTKEVVIHHLPIDLSVLRWVIWQ